MMMARDALKPDARFYVSRFHARNNTRDIFARKIFPPSRSRLVPKRRSRSRQSYRGPRRMHIRDLLPLSPS